MNIGQLSIIQPFLGMRLCTVAISSCSAYGCIVMIDGTVHAAPTGALLWSMVQYISILINGREISGRTAVVEQKVPPLWLRLRPRSPTLLLPEVSESRGGLASSLSHHLSFTDVCALPAAHTLRAGLVVLESCFLYHYIMLPNNSLWSSWSKTNIA